MVVTLTGNNVFGWQAELTDLVRSAETAYGPLAVEKIDGAVADLAQINQALDSPPFLTAKKLVVLREPNLIKGFSDQIKTIVDQLSDTTDLVIVEPKLDKRQAYSKFLAASTDYKEFAALDEAKLITWVINYVKKLGGEISSSLAKTLIERVGQDQLRLSSELAKLVLFEPKISLSSIETMTEKTLNSSVFELLDASFKGERRRATQIYKEQIAMNVQPAQIVAMLAWQLHVLALIKTAGSRSGSEIAAQAKLNPYVVNKSLPVAKSLSLGRLKDLTGELVAIEETTKTRSVDASQALENYLLKLSLV